MKAPRIGTTVDGRPLYSTPDGPATDPVRDPTRMACGCPIHYGRMPGDVIRVHTIGCPHLAGAR